MRQARATHATSSCRCGCKPRASYRHCGIYSERPCRSGAAHLPPARATFELAPTWFHVEPEHDVGALCRVYPSDQSQRLPLRLPVGNQGHRDPAVANDGLARLGGEIGRLRVSADVLETDVFAREAASSPPLP